MRIVALAIVLSAAAVAAQEDLDAGARRASEAAIQQLLAGKAAPVWTLLRQSGNNSVRSFVTEDLSRLGVRADVLVARLRSESDVSVRRALLLALGGYSADELSKADGGGLDALTRRLYSTDPDSGTHAAAGWLLRRMNPEAWAAIASTLGDTRPANARWSLTAEGQMMVSLVGPTSVRMGSPDDEAGRQPASDSPAEPQHEVTIPRSFALSATEVTRAEFARFLAANPDAARDHAYPGSPGRMADVLARFSPEDDDPAIAVTWYEAAMYCNWLSAREGLPSSEWVYPSPIGNQMEMPPDYLHRRGYRLPTEAEWEYAARAGTSTARFFGETATLLPQYAWFARHPPGSKTAPVDPNDPQQTARVGLLKPNDFGLFDIYGNVWEWTQDRVERHQRGNVRVDTEDRVVRVVDSEARTRRGGAYPYPAAMARSAERGTLTSLPTNRRDNVGFRIARTLAPR